MNKPKGYFDPSCPVCEGPSVLTGTSLNADEWVCQHCSHHWTMLEDEYGGFDGMCDYSVTWCDREDHMCRGCCGDAIDAAEDLDLDRYR